MPNDPTKIISTPDELANALIYWFNTYAKQYDLDANVIAAQAYAESSYVIWNYAQYDSTASGISQVLMSTIWDLIIRDNGKAYNSSNPITPEEVYALNYNLEQKDVVPSYRVSTSVAWDNRPLLHQNVINNPGIMIKAQCKYMNYIAGKCGNLTSSALFGYNRGPLYAQKTYTQSIVDCKNGKESKAAPGYEKEGLKYVLKIFGVLGDKENWLTGRGLGRNYKPIGQYFGYDDNIGDKTKNLRLKESFTADNASIVQSNQQYPDKTTTA
jgi:hypothetical protein